MTTTYAGYLADMTAAYQTLEKEITKRIGSTTESPVRDILNNARLKIAIDVSDHFGLRDSQAGFELLGLSDEMQIEFLKEWGKRNDVNGLLSLGV